MTGSIAGAPLVRFRATHQIPVHPSLEQIGCANTVFYWDQPEDRSILKKCGKCKVVEYCSVDCQAEHWDLVHKKHCKKLVLAKKAAVEQDLGDVSTTFPVGLFSHHPFPLAGLLGNTMEMLIILNQRVLYKMAETGHPAWDLPEVRQFEQSLRENRQIIWAQRKLSPEKEITPDKMVQCENEGAAFFCQRSIQSFGDPSVTCGPLSTWCSRGWMTT